MMHRIIRRHLPLSLVALATLGAAGCDSLPTLDARFNVTPPAHNPILFVHGWNGSSASWDPMISRFKADGWTDAQLVKWGYNSSQSNVTTAKQLSAKVDSVLAATGASKVDIVTHSMGGLSSRYYAKNLGGDLKVEAWVSLGGPNHGTDFANLCFTASCTEMRIGSTFLKNLNAVDETPGSPRYGTWWSACDEVINPDSSVPLVGATNTKTSVCFRHSGFFNDATTYAQVRDFVK